MSVSSFRRLTVLFVVLGLVASGAGCAALRQAAARQHYIQGKTQDHVYAKPLAEIWPVARQMLFESNYEVKDTGEAGVFTLETEWAAGEKTRSRYLVQGIKVDEHSCKVQFTRVSGPVGENTTQTVRDLDMEWQLLKRVDPQRAMEIEGEANEQAKLASR